MPPEVSYSERTHVDVSRIYVDTAIFHYLLVPTSKVQENKSFQALKDSSDKDAVECITSSFTLLEEYDTWKGRALVIKALKDGNISYTSVGIRLDKDHQPLSQGSRCKAVSKVTKALGNSFIRRQDPAIWPTEIIELFCRSSNLLWPDACQISFALVLRCDYFLTTDNDLYEEIKLKLNSKKQAFHFKLAKKL